MKKKFLLSLLSLLIFTLFNYVEAKADDKTVFYRNCNGVEFTKEEYERISACFNEDALYVMDKEMAENLKMEKEIVEVSSQTIYVELIETTDSSGKIVNTSQRILSEKVGENYANNYVRTVYSLDADKVHTTSMKKITLSMYIGGSASWKYANITNEWLSLPKIRSYDIIALRPGKASVVFTYKGLSGCQVYDGKRIEYSSTSDNLVYKSGVKDGTGGLAYVMNLKDDVVSTLKNTMSVQFVTGADPFTVYGTYQHAIKNISKLNAKKFTFSPSGMGGVLNFKSSIGDYYDNTKGLSVTVSMDIL